MSLDSDLMSEVQFECSICLDVFSNPVSLPCGHSFCQACIGGYWDSTDLCLCPLCKESFQERPKLRINRSLSEFAEFFKKKKKKGGASGPEQPCAKPGQVACDVCTGPRLRAARSCLVCLASYCEGHLAAHSARFSKHLLVDPLPNLEDRMCPKHQRPLDLFCKSERTCVCVQCAKPDHRGHTVVSVEDAVQEFKTLLRKSVTEVHHMIHERVRKVEEIGQSVELSKASVEREAAAGAQVIGELMSSVAAVRSRLTEAIEEQQRAACRRAEGLVGDLNREICDLKSRNADLDQLLHTKDCIHFLQGFSSLSALPHMKDWSDIAVHADLCVDTTRTAMSQIEKTLKKLLQNLSESELRKVQQSAVDVTLDPKTANRWLIVSEDGKQVREGDGEQDVPDGPERFSDCACVLGKEGFSSGRRYWEVQVGDKTDWDLGVASQSANRKGDIEVSPEEGYWTMCLRDGTEYSACANRSFTLAPPARLRTVGVYVDYEAGQISFYNVDARSHVYTFHGTFSGTLYPFLSPYLSDRARNSTPLVISPIGIEIGTAD
ncbi:E3 ubiquitin-protein ligase TRIM39-like [Anguilla anguilla]|uniref:E3 ubiquitin-protein ligase TRIM39-like n=1 Tax=Anguilla anguilla TaxID=7936 RepID=UPI0015AA8CCE|nr:E3 ubiquitin-protein ligase TRIM39-like [Anguilla anguilla]XP_035281062.1 E3 ubiquitin-protein ligase TRIM39-like [Anguilla anguilla]